MEFIWGTFLLLFQVCVELLLAVPFLLTLMVCLLCRILLICLVQAEHVHCLWAEQGEQSTKVSMSLLATRYMSCALMALFLLQLKALRDKMAMHMLAFHNSRVNKEDLLATIPRINSDWPQPRAGASTQSQQLAAAVVGLARYTPVAAMQTLIHNQLNVATLQSG